MITKFVDHRITNSMIWISLYFIKFDFHPTPIKYPIRKRRTTKIVLCCHICEYINMITLFRFIYKSIAPFNTNIASSILKYTLDNLYMLFWNKISICKMYRNDLCLSKTNSSQITILPSNQISLLEGQFFLLGLICLNSQLYSFGILHFT